MLGVALVPRYESARWDLLLSHFPEVTHRFDAYEGAWPDVPLVLLQPKDGKFVQGEVSLAEFQHPEECCYIVGSDFTDLVPTDIPKPDFSVYIPQHPRRGMVGRWALAMALWDRRMKRG